MFIDCLPDTIFFPFNPDHNPMRQRPWLSPGNHSPVICLMTHNSVCPYIHWKCPLSFSNNNKTSMSLRFLSSETPSVHLQVYSWVEICGKRHLICFQHCVDVFVCFSFPTLENKVPTVSVHEGLLLNSPTWGSESVSWVVWAKASDGICLGGVTSETVHVGWLLRAPLFSGR